ncbi:phage terminase large subunit family protein [Escherichia coli]|nr:phage terminase large subunit family protein [Escherichia coli]
MGHRGDRWRNCLSEVKKTRCFPGAAGKRCICLWQAGDHHAKNPQSAGRYLCEVGTDTAKEILYARMKAEPTPADEATSYAIRFPDDPEIFSQTEAQQLVAEELVEKWEKGKMRLLWDNKKRRNEALDCLVYAYAALRVSVQRWQLDLAVLAKSREEETTRPTLKELAAKLSGGVNGYSR